MTRSAAERTSPRAIPQQSPVSPPPDVGLRGQQLALIDVIVSVPYFIDWWQAVIPPRHG
jgi:hypothetical protein